MKIKFEIDLNVNLKTTQESELLRILKTINQKLNTMPTKEEMRAAIDEIKSAADNIAADIERLANQAEGGLSAEDATAFVDELRTVGTQLRAVADKNPEPNPENPE